MINSPLIIIQSDNDNNNENNNYNGKEIQSGELGIELDLKLSNLSQDKTSILTSKSSFISKNLSWFNFKKFKLILGGGDHCNNNSITSISSINTINSSLNYSYSLSDSFKTTFYSNSKLFQLDSIYEKSTEYWKSELSQSNCYWLDIKSYNLKDLELLKNLLKLTNLTLNELKNPSNINENWHQYDNYFYFSISLPSNLNQNYLHVLITKNGILTLSQCVVNSRIKAIKRILALSPHLKINPGLLTYSLLDLIIDEVIVLVNDLEFNIDLLDDELFIKSKKNSSKFEIILNEGVVTKLEVYQLKLIQLQKLISGKKDLIRCLNRRYLLNPNLKLYLGDLDDHLLTTLSNLHFLEKQLIRIQNTITAQKSYENLKKNYNCIKPSLNLMYLGIVFSISSIISTIWGIRCIVPGQRLLYKELFPYSNFILIEFGSILLGGFLTWLANWYLIGVRGY